MSNVSTVPVQPRNRAGGGLREFVAGGFQRLLVVLIVGKCVCGGFAQTGHGLELTWFNIDAGGAIGNGQLVMTLTLGQPDAQTVSGGGLAIECGFQAASRPGQYSFGFGDDFSERGEMSGLPASAAGFNAGMTKESSEPNHAGNVGGKSIWWTWTAPSSGPVTIHTLGSSFDTLLAVYSGNNLSNLLLVASNNNISLAISNSAVTFTAVAGTEYQIAVDGFNGAEGIIALMITPPVGVVCPADITVETFAQVPSVNPEVMTPLFACEPVIKSFVSDVRSPSNCQTEIVRSYRLVDACGRTNTCSQRITVNQPGNDDYGQNIILLTGLPVSTNGCNANATWQSGDWQWAPYGDEHTVWWTWLAPRSTTVVVDTIGSSFDTALVITDGGIDNIKALNDNGGGNGQARIKFSTSAGRFYGIMVDGPDGETGNIKLNISECPPPRVIGYTSSQSVQPDGIHVTICADAQGTGQLNFNWNDGAGHVISEFGNCCEVVVDPSEEGTNLVTLNLSDDCDGIETTPPITSCAVCLNRGTPTLLNGSAGSTTRGPTSTGNCGSLSDNTRWFKMVVGDDAGPVTLSTEGSTQDTLLAVFSGSILSPAPIECNEAVGGMPQSRLTFSVTPRTQYWIAVDPRTPDAPTLKLAAGFAPRIDSYRFTSNHVFEVFSTNAPAIPYRLEMTTNLALNPVIWATVQVTNAMTNAPYLLHFRDTNAATSVRRYYRLRSLP